MKIILESNRLAFREMNDDDFIMLKKIIRNHDGSLPSDEYVHKWLDWCKSSYQQYGFGHLAVLDKETNEMIGSAGLSMQPINDNLLPEIGYHLREDYQGKGLGKELAVALRDYYFKNTGFDELYSYMDEDNVRSFKTAESMGMKYVYSFTSKYGGVYKVYKITREEFNKLNTK